MSMQDNHGHVWPGVWPTNGQLFVWLLCRLLPVFGPGFLENIDPLRELPQSVVVVSEAFVFVEFRGSCS